MRRCRFFALPTGKKLEQIFSTIALETPCVFRGKHGEMEIFDVGAAQFVAQAIMVGVTPKNESSTDASGKWDVWQIISVGRDDEKIEVLFKALDKAQKGSANKVGAKRHFLGPWKTKEFDALAWVGDQLCYEQAFDLDAQGKPTNPHKKPGAPLQAPWSIMGDDPVDMATDRVEEAPINPDVAQGKKAKTARRRREQP